MKRKISVITGGWPMRKIHPGQAIMRRHALVVVRRVPCELNRRDRSTVLRIRRLEGEQRRGEPPENVFHFSTPVSGELDAGVF